MNGKELIDLNKQGYKFIKKDGKHIWVHRIIDFSEDEIGYTTLMPNLVNDKDYSVESDIKKIKTSDICEVIKK